MSNLVLNIKDISTCAFGDRYCCVSQIVKSEVREPKCCESRFVDSF